MRKMGIRERLMVFYGLMALAPILVAGYLLYLYLGGQTERSLADLQTRAEHQLQQSHRATTQATEQALQHALESTQPALEHQLHQFREMAHAQQGRALQKSLHSFSEHLQNDLRRVQHETERSTQKTLTEVSQRIERVQTQALTTLLQESSESARGIVAELIKAQIDTLAQSLSRQVDHITRHYTAQLTLVAQQPAILNWRETEGRWILQHLQNREPAYQLLAVLDSKGRPRTILSDDELAPDTLQKLITPLWDSIQGNNELVIGYSVMLALSGDPEPYVPMMVPILHRGTELVGAVFALASLEEVQHLLQTFRLGKQGIAFIVTADGTILTHPNPKQVGTKMRLSLPNDPTLAQEVNTPEGRIVVSTARIAPLDALLVVMQPSEEAFQLVATLQQRLQQSYQEQSAQTLQSLHQIRKEVKTQLVQQRQRSEKQLDLTVRQTQQETQAQLSKALDTLSQDQRQNWITMLQNGFQSLQERLQAQLATKQTEIFNQTRQQFRIIRQQIAEDFINQMQTVFLLSLCMVGIFLILGGAYLHRTLVRPLRAIIQASNMISQGDLKKRVILPFRGCSDLNHLADALNHMIDSLRQAEAQIVQSSKLASLGTLASGVAHELNQPLAIIRAIAQQNLETLRKGALTPESHHTLEEDLEIVERQTARMSQIILHLRTFARKPKAVQDPVSLNEVAQNALILLREQLRQRGIQLIESYTEPLPPVMGEANALEQIVINLLTNARDALENVPDAEIRIWTQVQEQEGATWVLLGIADNGPGVPEEIRAQIFDPFFTTKDPNKGTGLGLSISLEIAQKHKGTLQLEPTERGACFVLKLPASQAQRTAA